jgi:hypothetical protein
MATTTPYGIYYPIASDSVAPLHTAFSTLADSVNTALNTYVAPLTATQQNGAYTVSTVGAMNAITGMVAGSTCFVTGTKASYQYSGTSWVLMYQPWTDYSPSAITGLGFAAAKYTVVNNMVNVYLKIARVGTPTSANVTVSLPITSATVVDTKLPIGSGIFYDAGLPASFKLDVWHNSTTSARIVYLAGNPLKAIDLNLLGSTPAAFNTTVDYITVNFTYQLP